MKFCIFDTYYSGFLKSFWRKNSRKGSFEKLRSNLLSSFFGTGDFFSYNLKKLGYEAQEFVMNDEITQEQWAKENNLKIEINPLLSRIKSLPLISRFLSGPDWVQKTVLFQVKKEKPDIVYIQNLSVLSPNTLKEIKESCKLLVGQIASPLPPKNFLEEFDLIITSFPHYVDIFKRMGIKSEYQKLAFERRLLKRIGERERIYDVVFIGSFTPYHQKGTRILEEVAKHTPIHVWGQGIEFLSPLSPIRENYHGEAWGLDMYKILAQSKIVLNRHIDVAGNYANNMRLYEATGMGAMLITDDKENLDSLFKVGKEVVAYRNGEDLIEKVNNYLKHDRERKKIAVEGQKRTLKEHTYLNRMKELEKIIKNYV